MPMLRASLIASLIALLRAMLWAGVAAGAALLVLAGPAAGATPGSEPTRTFAEAIVAAGDTHSFPEDAPQTVQALPDDWAASRPGFDGVVWYRVHFDAPPLADPEAVLALYVERACTNLEVHLNGHRVYSGGRMGEPVTRNCYQPQLVALPAALLRAQGNTLDLKLRGHALERVASRQRAAGLSVLRIGPMAALAPAWRAQQFWNVTAPQLLGVTLFVLGVFMIGVGWFNRRASYLMYFGTMSIIWSLLTARIWLADPPLSNRAAEFAVTLGFAPIVGFAIVFLLRYARIKRRPLDIALIAQCFVMPLSLAVLGPDRLYAGVTFWYWMLGLELLGATVVYLRVSWASQRNEFWVMSAILVLFACMVVLEAVQHAAGGGIWRGHALRFAFPVFVLVVSFRLVQVFARALRAAEAGRSTLEARIQEATQEIERNFAQLAELRVEQVTEKERKRIASDLHDDLGAKLLTIVHTSESERISTLAREALEEMRLSVRGMTGRAMRVADALADWRAETVSRLGQANIEAEWTGPTDDSEQLMSARAFVQTTRILREAVNNIIKHSGASHCKVSCMISADDVNLVVQDNGRGIPLELDGRLDRGHGMSSMKHRAKQMRGQCLVESGPGYGTVIRLTLPL
ncbi:MAG TPA: ATP-binding protein [Burkholderiaceae bacterium]|nr:ATP-binding protein [Burkholderiaceae bacterium]